jgi:membrane protease YdiL (CAAX protease family)
MTTKPDFPYYNGVPVEISPFGWLAVVASVGVAFALLITLPFPSFPLNLVPAIVYTGLPILALAWASGGRQMALFGSIGIKDIAVAIGFGLLTMVASFAVGFVLLRFISMNANPVGAELAALDAFGVAVFMVRTAIQLVGEELMTILPLLAVLWLCVSKFGLPRWLGLTIAVIVSTAWFAAVHLPTYNWNFIQCFGGIGAARLVLTAAFLVTRKLWVSAGAHIVNDWTEFFLPTLLSMGHTPIDTAA